MRALVLLVTLATAIVTLAPRAEACSGGGCPDGWPDDCFNLKATKWCSKTGVSEVTMTNHGSYESAFDWATILVSAGRRGLQIELAPRDLVRLTEARVARIARG